MAKKDKKADIGAKRIVGLDPTSWVRWVSENPNFIAKEIISSDFQWISRQNDILILTADPIKEENIIILCEIQLSYTNKMPRRIRAYTALAEEKYELPVYPVLVNILPTNQNIQYKYESTCYGLYGYQDYKVLNLWEIEAEIAFSSPFPCLLPFVPIMKGGDSSEQVQKAFNQLRQNERFDGLEQLLGFFASFVLESDVVQRIMRWDMEILMQSPWYQEIKGEGKKEGLIEGIQISLESKFGAVGQELMAEIKSLEIDQLKSILKGIQTVENLEDIRRFYQ